MSVNQKPHPSASELAVNMEIRKVQIGSLWLGPMVLGGDVNPLLAKGDVKGTLGDVDIAVIM